MIKVGIIGASGYTGGELIRLLLNHSQVEITCLTSRTYDGKPVASLFPNLRGLSDLTFEGVEPEVVAEKCDVVFTAVPHGVAFSVVPVLRSAGKKVIDLAADYRLKKLSVYETWYKLKHEDPEGVSRAAYGLPELFRDEIRCADIVANPGCYPTSAILRIAPALKNGIVSHQNIVINAVSGVSGAGRKSELAYSFCETDENFKAYGIANHRHTPEIEQELSLICGKPVTVSFTPHLAPLKRGMLATSYLDLNSQLSPADIHTLYADYYRNEPFVRILPLGQFPETKYVAGSNYIDIGIAVDHRVNKLIVISALDNLGKGSAGQAVQALNIMAGFDETKGLLTSGLYL